MATATDVARNGTTGVPATVKEMEFTPFMSKESIKLSVSIVQRMLCVPTRNGNRCDDVQAMKFMMLCKARQLNPFEGDAYLVGYDTNDGPQFSLITAHQAFLKRAEVHPEYDGMESGVMVLDKDGQLHEREGDFCFDADTLVGGWATVFFKKRSHPIKKRLKLSTFNTGQSRWRKDPAGMIVKCAEADALRSAFPTQLGGMYIDGEMLGGDEPAVPKRNARIAASDLTDFAKAHEPPEVEAEVVSEMPEVEAVQDILAQLEQAVIDGDVALIARLDNEHCGPDSELTDMQMSIVAAEIKRAKASVGKPKSSGELFEKQENTGA